MQFVETYEHSLGTFLAQIGGLLEFWLGCNVIALLHCMAYLFKYIYYLSTKKSNGDTPSVLYSLERRAEEIAALRGQLCIDMAAAREAAQNGTLIERDDDSSGHWLYKNRFYETTSITGFQFIANARLGLERLFWAVLILIFLVITLFNVYTTVQYYGHRPTLISTKLLHDSPKIQLGNLTMKFKAHLIELTELFPTILDFEDSEWSNLPITDHVACEFSDVPDENSQFTEQAIRWHIFMEMVNFEHWTLNQTDWPKVPPVQSAEEILQNWLDHFEEGAKGLLEFWERYKSSPLPRNLTKRQIIDQEFTDLLSAPLKERNLNPLYGFLLLEAFNTGLNPQTKLLELLNKEFGASYWTEFQPTGQTIDELLGGVSAFQLAKRMEREMNKMILIRVIDEPDAQISLQGWSYESETSESSTTTMYQSLIRQQLEYRIILPQNHSRTQVQIVTYSFLRMWHKYVLDALHDHFEKNNRLAEEFICKLNSRSIDSLIEQKMNNFLVYILPYSKADGYMILTTENFDSTTLSEMYAEDMLLHITGAFHSNTHNCSTISSQQCLDHCFRVYSMETCGCQPWPLLYLGEEGPVCTAPCTPPTHCLQQCQQVMQHPCNFVQSKAERTQNHLKLDYLDTAQHHVVIKTTKAVILSHISWGFSVGKWVLQAIESGSYRPSSLFHCPHDGCIKQYQYKGNLDRHQETGKHVYRPVRESTQDISQRLFAQKLEEIHTSPLFPELNDELNAAELKTSRCQARLEVLPEAFTDQNLLLKRGWALQQASTHVRFNTNQISFLNVLFDEGKRTNKKCNPKEVSKSMPKAVNDETDQLRFEPNEYLTVTQIMSYFTCRAALDKKTEEIGRKEEKMETDEDDPREETPDPFASPDHKRPCAEVLEPEPPPAGEAQTDDPQLEAENPVDCGGYEYVRRDQYLDDDNFESDEDILRASFKAENPLQD